MSSSAARRDKTLEWTIKLEARTGWGEVETIEVGRLKRRVVGLTADEIGLTLAEGKDFLSELQRLGPVDGFNQQ